MDRPVIRLGVPEDVAAVGALHVAAWRETYRGILPQALLDDLSVDDHSAMWRAMLADPPASGGAALFVATIVDAIVGFGACGTQRDPDLAAQGFDGEIGAIYILRRHQHAGAGKALMRRMARYLMNEGRSGVSLWVLRENRVACFFYESLGGRIIGERTDGKVGAVMVEVAYGWPLPALAD